MSVSYTVELNGTQPVHLISMRSFKKLGIATAGFVLLLTGLIMVVLPGPGLLVMIAGISVLAGEFDWAKRILRRGKLFGRQAKARLRASTRRIR